MVANSWFDGNGRVERWKCRTGDCPTVCSVGAYPRALPWETLNCEETKPNRGRGIVGRQTDQPILRVDLIGVFAPDVFVCGAFGNCAQGTENFGFLRLLIDCVQANVKHISELPPGDVQTLAISFCC